MLVITITTKKASASLSLFRQLSVFITNICLKISHICLTYTYTPPKLIKNMATLNTNIMIMTIINLKFKLLKKSQTFLLKKKMSFKMKKKHKK